MLRQKNLTLLVYGLVLLFFLYDISEDLLTDHESGAMLWLEAAIFALIGALLWQEISARLVLREAYQRERALRERLSGNLRHHIERQFDSWALTNSEQEIAWLLLQGYAFQEIAALRSVKEKTVRQQASAIYAKSGAAGRAEFVALFLEDLLMAAQQTENR